MIIDADAHIGEIKDFLCFDPSVENLLKRMDELKVDVVINADYYGLDVPDFDRGAEVSINLYNVSNGKLVNYFNYNPKHMEKCLEVIEKYHDHPAFVGIKIHPSMHHIFADDESYRPVWEIAKKYGLPIMSHTWALSDYNPRQKFAVPGLFEKYIKEYPEVDFIFGHSGGRTEGVREAAALAAKYANAYLDIAGDPFEFGVVDYLVKNGGEDKVLFGTDVFWFDFSPQLGMVLGANISDEAKEKVFKTNALKVFKKLNK